MTKNKEATVRKAIIPGEGRLRNRQSNAVQLRSNHPISSIEYRSIGTHFAGLCREYTIHRCHLQFIMYDGRGTIEVQMCGRYTLAQGEKIIEAIPNVTIREDLREVGHWNIAPTQEILVVANRETGAGRGVEVEPMRWGLVPSWAKDASIGSKMINARAETLAEKPAFRKALERRRCVIPADGFYEWRKNPDGTKTPIYARLKTGRCFAFAGLWDTRQGPDGKSLTTCTIITTEPNALLSPIHNRMPAILPPEAVQDWLDPRPRPPEEMLAWLKPYPADEMEAYAMSRSVNSATRDGPELVAQVEDVPEQNPQRKQGRGTAPQDTTAPRAGDGVPKRRRKSEDPNQGQLF